jgi:type III pantothenate kinase
MSVDVVVDVGNTCIKWGRCSQDQVDGFVALAPEDPGEWGAQWQKWHMAGSRSWAIAGVHPQRRDMLAGWLRECGEIVQVLTSPEELPLEVELPQPERVGIDRLLNAVAANTRRAPNRPAVLVDAGSAVTVDYVDAAGAFRGGAILPGLRLMAQALHDYTAVLPLVEVSQVPPAVGTNTIEAMQSGIFRSVLGGIRELLHQHEANNPGGLDVFLTGGDSLRLAPELMRHRQLDHWPQMTLEGIRIAVAAGDRAKR